MARHSTFKTSQYRGAAAESIRAVRRAKSLLLGSRIAPSHSQKLAEARAQALEGRTVEAVDLVLIRPNGEEQNVSASLSPKRDATGAITGISIQVTVMVTGPERNG